MKIFADLNLNEIESELITQGIEKFRAKQIFDAIMQAKDYDNLTNLPKSVVEKIKENYVLKPANIEQVFVSVDGTKKYLIKLFDGNLVESVFLFQNYGNTICLSTQVGCRMGCKFCASTKNGLIRNLSAGEMLGIIATLNADNGISTERNFRNIVLMGSGEPLDNYDNVIKFVRTICDKTTFNISERNISLSTCGLIENMKKLMNEKLNITLCLSLHASCDEQRKQNMPIANKYKIEDLIATLREYVDETKRRVMIEYCLIKGFNDSDEDVERLAKLLKNLICMVNVIKLNENDDKLKAPTKQDCYDFVKKLNEKGICATIRRSQGEDIKGACGQLKNAYIDKK